MTIRAAVGRAPVGRTVGRSLRRALRGPVRSHLRELQRRAPLTAGARQPGPPDYVGIGVQRCGTSWWQTLIEAHPLVTPLGFGAKELHFFDPFWNQEITDADIARYSANFRRAPGCLAGEWTPRYLYDPWAVPALLQAAPATRLLVMLRDPVARFRSGLRHARQRGETLTADQVTDAFQRGLYAKQVARLLELVPPSQVLILQFERCCREPATMLRETFDFLALPAADVALTGAVNSSDRPMAIRPALMEEVRARYAPDAAALADILPDRIDLSLWPEISAPRPAL